MNMMYYNKLLYTVWVQVIEVSPWRLKGKKKKAWWTSYSSMHTNRSKLVLLHLYMLLTHFSRLQKILGGHYTSSVPEVRRK